MHSFKQTSQLGLIAALMGCAAWSGAACGAPPETDRETVLLFAAASTKEFVEDVVAEFRRTHPRVVVKTSYGGSSTLARQVMAGAEADLFLSANHGWAKTLDQRKLVAQQRELLGNELALIVAKGSKRRIAAPEDLLAGDIHRVALAEPGSVPAGIYAKQALVKLALWDRLKPRVVGAADVRQALAYVETGAADAGIVYATDAALSDRVEIACRLDAELTEPIVYPLVLLEHGSAKLSVRELYQEFQSDRAAEFARKRGFTWRLPGSTLKP